MPKQISHSEKHIECRLAKLTAKVVKATEMSFCAKKLCEESNLILIDAQSDISDLYESIGDVLKLRTEKTQKQPLENINMHPLKD